MTRTLQIVRLQVRIFLQDRGDLAFALLLPIAVLALMYGAFGGPAQFHATARVVNEDPDGQYARVLLDRMEALDELEVELLSRAEARRKLERSDVLLVVVIPSGFSERLAAGEPARLVFWQRGNGGYEGQVVASIIRGLAEEISRGLLVRDEVRNTLAGSGIAPERIDVTVSRFLERERQAPLVAVVEEAVGSRPDVVSQFLPGIITMFVLFSLTLSAQALVEERRLGTLERLLTTPLTVGELFTGKFLASVSCGFIQTFILLALAYAVFQFFTPLTFLSALVVALVFAAAASGFGLIIMAVARTPDQAAWIGVVFTMSLVMISGTFFPIEEGSAFEIASKISINTYANEAFHTLITGSGTLGDVWPEIAVMLGVAVAGFAVSRLLFRALPGGR